MATESGRLFVWGKVTKNEDEEPIMKPTPVPFFFDVPIKHIACGKGFTAILTGKWFALQQEHNDQRPSILNHKQKKMKGKYSR